MTRVFADIGGDLKHTRDSPLSTTMGSDASSEYKAQGQYTPTPYNCVSQTATVAAPAATDPEV